MQNEGGLTSAMGLEEAVEDALQGHPEISRYPIDVSVQGTTVSLRGEVDSEASKENAEQIARGVQGVIDVINELVVVDRDSRDWPFADRARARSGRDADGGVDPTLGVAALGAANRGMAGTGASSGTGSGVGAGGLGALAAVDTEAAAEDQAEAQGYGGREDTENIKGERAPASTHRPVDACVRGLNLR